MNIEKMREEFEAWYLAEYYEGDKQCGLEWLSTEPCGGYRYAEPVKEWKVWQASRQSLVIELPERLRIDHRGDYWDGARNGFNQCIDTCANSIRLAGVKCEVKS